MMKVLPQPYEIFFQTLGNETRWKIVHLLETSKHKTTDIAKILKYEQSLISHHLRRLEICGFVKVERNGKERIYQLNRRTIKPLLKLMDEHINKFCKKIAEAI